jgi:hypothetical protein
MLPASDETLNHLTFRTNVLPQWLNSLLKNSGFVSGYRFSDTISSEFQLPLQGWVSESTSSAVAHADAPFRIFLQKDISFAVAPGAMLNPNTTTLSEGLWR